MNLLIERGPAAAAMSRAIGIVEKRQIIPILGNVALFADGATLTVRATDLEGEVLETIPAVVDGAGSITVPADKLHAIFSNADGGSQIKIAIEEGDPRAKVRFGRSNYSLPTLPAHNFPQFPHDGLDEGFDLPAATLAEMISRVAWSTEAGDKLSIKGVVFLGTQEIEGVGRQLHAMGACNAGLSLVRMEAPEAARLSVLMPPKVSSHIRSWLNGAEGTARVRCAYGQGEDRPATLIQVQHGGATYTSKLFDAPGYFDYVARLVEGHDHSARVARDELERAIRRVLVMADGKTSTLNLTFNDGSLSIRARGDASGEGIEEIGAEFEGPESVMMFTGSHLLNALGAMRGDIVELCFAPKATAEYITGLVVLRAPCDSGLLINAMQPKA